LGEDCDAGARAREDVLYSISPFPDQSDEFLRPHHPAVVLEPIRKEFGLDDTALGILGASFTLIYAVAGVPLGYLADRFRRTRILAAGLMAWSLLRLPVLPGALCLSSGSACWLASARRVARPRQTH
jgi:MFS family permease